MTENVVALEDLRKTYVSWRGRSSVALDGLDLEVPHGGVFGLLGPNGSGKTTTIRCLLALARRDGGHASVLGVDPERSLHSVAKRIGAIVESPALFPNMSGRRNLEILAHMDGVDRRRVEEVLDIVDLRERAPSLVRSYSLGMRQRLAIAAALLKDPELLILDEPANGLDPAGIRDVRALLKRLGAQGGTVIVSSHILKEIEQTCDRVAILSKGRCIAEGPVADVLRRNGPRGTLVRVRDAARAASILQGEGLAAVLVGGGIEVAVDPAQADTIARVLGERGIYPVELRPVEIDLETVFLELTGEEAA